jgi:signal transduction histidine kinase
VIVVMTEPHKTTAGRGPERSRRDDALVRAVGRVPLSVRAKILVPFVGTVALLVVVGILGLRVLGDANDRIGTLGSLEGRATAYSQLEADTAQLQLLLGLRASAYESARKVTTPNTTECGNACPEPGQNNGITVSLIPIEQLRTIDGAITSTLYSSKLSRLAARSATAGLGFVPPDDERSTLTQIGEYALQLSDVMARIIVFDKSLFTAAGPTAGMQLQHDQGEPLANEMAALTGTLASTTQTAIDALIERDRSAFSVSQGLFVAVALGSIILSLLLGYLLSRSLTSPIRQMETRLEAIAVGDFSGHVEVSNRDELGALATNLNRMNDELGRLYRELEAASRHKSEFLATMSHELRTPLNAIIGFSQVLKQQMYGPLNERQAEYIDDVLTSGQHLLNLINDILDLAKVEAGRMELQPTIFPLPPLLQSAVSMIRERAAREGLEVETSIDASVGSIEGDERKIKQIVYNLLSNAVKFTAQGGRVSLTARATADQVELAVKDTGVGISAEEQAKVFEEFYQVGSAMSQEGTGLGLALTRRLVELHGGHIGLESEPGKGSTFTVTLPLHMKAVDGGAASGEAAEPAAS